MNILIGWQYVLFFQYRAVPEDVRWTEGLDGREDQWDQFGRCRERPGVGQGASAQAAEPGAGAEADWRKAQQNEHDG